jgi:signal transduction histidine kinase
LTGRLDMEPTTNVSRISSGARRIERAIRRDSDRIRAFAVSKERHFLSPTALVRAVRSAAAHASESIAQSTKRPVEDVRRRVAPVLTWLLEHTSGTRGERVSPTPIVAQEVVDRLRSHLVAELLQSDEEIDGREIVRVLAAFETLTDEWKRTDRGQFMARLAGPESASAVVAIAHDIRSPLSSILILVDSLRRGLGAKISPNQERQLGLIYGAAHGLTTLASDLIDAARGEALSDDEPIPFSVTETMLAVGAIVQPIAEEKGLPLMLDKPKTHARIGHAASLHRVLLNLTSNALRYTDSGSVTLGCREASPTKMEFWIQDTGRGLPPKVQESLFDAFRPEAVALRFSSAGLGLATVRALLAALDSQLVVHTGPETGTRFSFELELPPSPR